MYLCGDISLRLLGDISLQGFSTGLPCKCNKMKHKKKGTAATHANATHANATRANGLSHVQSRLPAVDMLPDGSLSTARGGPRPQA